MSLTDFLIGTFDMEPKETWTLWDGKEIIVQHAEPTDEQKLTCLGIWDRYLNISEIEALQESKGRTYFISQAPHRLLTDEERDVLFNDGKGLEYPEFR